MACFIFQNLFRQLFSFLRVMLPDIGKYRYMNEKEADRMDHKMPGPVALLNGMADFALLLLSFFLAGLLRMVIPLDSRFSLVDLSRFFPVALIYAVVLLLCYAGTGCDRSPCGSRVFKEGFKIAVINILGLALVGTVLSVFRLSQFSRPLLLYFYLITTFLILAKRRIVNRLTTVHEQRKNLRTNVLIIGSADTARRYYTNIVRRKKFEMNYVGYLDEQPSPLLPNYLGKTGELRRILQSAEVDKIIIALDTQSTVQLQTIIAMAETYKIHVTVIPVYNNFVGGRSKISIEEGLRLVDVKMMDTCKIMGVDIAVTDMEKTVRTIEEKLEEWRGEYICVANVHTTVTAHKDKAYRAVQQGAAMTLPDGGPLSQYSREQGYTEARRVTGPDLMKEILKISPQRRWRHYFYGSTPETLEILEQKIRQRYPGTIIAGMYSPPFRSVTPREDAACVEQINAAHPDFVWVGLGAPKQELWMAAHKGEVHALMIGVGAAFDYEAGNIRRAPLWMQRRNLEWLYRLMQDPRRLFKRYFTTNLSYLWWKCRQ